MRTPTDKKSRGGMQCFHLLRTYVHAHTWGTHVSAHQHVCFCLGQFSSSTKPNFTVNSPLDLWWPQFDLHGDRGSPSTGVESVWSPQGDGKKNMAWHSNALAPFPLGGFIFSAHLTKPNLIQSWPNLSTPLQFCQKMQTFSKEMSNTHTELDWTNLLALFQNCKN